MYSSDQEQIQVIKDFWKEYGTTILVAICIFLAANFGWRYWHNYKSQYTARASLAYTEMLSAREQHKAEEFNLFANRLLQDYTRSPYATFAALMLAKEAVDKNNFDSAITQLNWVIDHSKNASLRQIARLREARILLFTKKFQPALEMLAHVENNAFIPAVDEVKGDVLLAMNKQPEAIQAYEEGWRAVADNTIKSPLLELKIRQFKEVN